MCVVGVTFGYEFSFLTEKIKENAFPEKGKTMF